MTQYRYILYEEVNMMFVALLKARPGTQQERIARRMSWQAPEVGAEAVGEYWLETADPACVAVIKAEMISQLWAIFTGWDDLFEISIYPAVTAEEGLELLKKMAPA
jgi:hypothetical protein